MAPGIALDLMAGSGQSLRVLDPMAGSGTVIAVARANGHRAYGVDLDPLAVLTARVWTRSLNPEAVRYRAQVVLKRARVLLPEISAKSAYPTGSDEATQQFIRYWFDSNARRQLSTLATCISRVRCQVERDALWCAFSRLIIAKSAGASRARDLAHSRPHRHFARAPIQPLNHFISAVEVVVANCPHRGGGRIGPAADVRTGDARHLPYPDDSIDLVVTSPPYLNAIDYLRCSKFSLVWMGHSVSELRRIRSESIGAESKGSLTPDGGSRELVRSVTLRSLPPRWGAILERYAADIAASLNEISRVLVDGGKAVYVVGETNVRGVSIRNSAIVKAAADAAGFTIISAKYRTLPPNRRYMPPPRDGALGGAIDARVRREVVIQLQK